MRGTMLIYDPKNFKPTVVPLASPPDTHRLEQAVGGFIKLIPNFDTIDFKGLRFCKAFCNGNGRKHRLPSNSWATVLLTRAMGRSKSAMVDEFLVGPVVVIFGDGELMNALPK